MKMLISISKSTIRKPTAYLSIRLIAKDPIKMPDGETIGRRDQFYILFRDRTDRMPFIAREFTNGDFHLTKIKNASELNVYFERGIVRTVGKDIPSLFAVRGLQLPADVRAEFKIKELKAADVDASFHRAYKALSPAERIKQTREIAKIDQKKSTQQAIADKKFEMQMQKLLDSL